LPSQSQFQRHLRYLNHRLRTSVNLEAAFHRHEYVLVDLSLSFVVGLCA
jgi:hypothetical protein